jgi:hypothetical protein
MKYMKAMEVKINSNRLLDEFSTFVYNGDKIEHQPGFHDDLIFAFAIALLIRDTEFESVFLSTERTKEALSLISYSKNDISSIGLNGKSKESWETDDDFNDTSWLFG